MHTSNCCTVCLSGDRVIDVGSEWRTFSNEKALKDPSRVGDAQNPLLNGGDLTTMISKVQWRRPTAAGSLFMSRCRKNTVNVAFNHSGAVRPK